MIVGNLVTAVLALLGVLLGGWLSTRIQDRLWKRDHARQWRDIRLSVYKEYLGAYRQYVAFTVEPDVNISAIPHPRIPGTLMPVFDRVGRPYKERFDTASSTARLVSESTETTDKIMEVNRCARAIAASRAVHAVDEMLSDAFDRLWAAQDELLVAFRRELGLPPAPPTALDNPDSEQIIQAGRPTDQDR
jgi:hypothetical protein